MHALPKVFDPALIHALVATLHIALERGAEALIALTVRNEDTLSKFLYTAGTCARRALRVSYWFAPSSTRAIAICARSGCSYG